MKFSWAQVQAIESNAGEVVFLHFWISSNEFCIYLDHSKKNILQSRPICKSGAPPDDLLQKKTVIPGHHLYKWPAHFADHSNGKMFGPSSLQEGSPCGLAKQQEVQEGVKITGECCAFDHWEQRSQFDTLQWEAKQ